MGRWQVLDQEKGSVTVEFFLVLPLLILVLVAGLQVVSAARMRIELLGAVREGVRVAATRPDPAKAVAAVHAALSPDARDRTRISVSRPSVVGAQARVTATLRYIMALPFADDLGFDLHASAVMAVER